LLLFDDFVAVDEMFAEVEEANAEGSGAELPFVFEKDKFFMMPGSL
jgi:hypothetical protein